jgi:threonyl-tRNA synthetase
MLVMGDKEAAAGAVAVRLRTGEDWGAKGVDDFVRIAQEKIASRSLI